MRGGFCRPPRQLYPQEERGIQRPDNSTFTRLSPSQKWQIRSIFCTSDLCLTLLPKRSEEPGGKGPHGPPTGSVRNSTDGLFC